MPERNWCSGTAPSRCYWFSRIVSILSFQMLAVAVGWQLYAMTGSALDLGLVGLAQFLPMILLTLVVGHFADRYDRRAIVSCCQIVEAGRGGRWRSAARAAGWDRERSRHRGAGGRGARVRGADHGRAHAGAGAAAGCPARRWRGSISATQTAQIVGPALGGLLYWLGPGAVYGTAAALFVLAGVCIGTDSRRAARRARPSRVSAAARCSRASSSSRRDRILLGTLSLDLFAVLLGGATALLPDLSPATFCRPGRGDSGCCARRPAVGALVMSVSWRAGR